MKQLGFAAIHKGPKVNGGNGEPGDHSPLGACRGGVGCLKRRSQVSSALVTWKIGGEDAR